MAIIYVYNNSDGRIGASTNSWDGLHDASEAKTAQFTIGSATEAVKTTYDGSSDYTIFRAMMSFDTSAITSAPDEATLNIHGKGSNDTADIIVIKGAQDPTTQPTAAWYNDFDGWSALGFDDNNLTAYSSEISSWSTSGYNEIALNSTARADMASNNYFNIVILTHDYDYGDNAPTSAVDVSVGMYFSNEPGTSEAPYIEYPEGDNTPAGYESSDNFELKMGMLEFKNGIVEIK